MRPQRGPKKGQLRALRTQVEILKQQLGGQVGKDPTGMGDQELNGLLGPQMLVENMGYNTDGLLGLDDYSSIQFDWETPSSANGNIDHPVTAQPYHAQVQTEVPTTTASPTSSSTIATGHIQPAELEERLTPDILDDLDQVYFDRVHAIAPIVHKERYFTWTSQDPSTISPVRSCLRQAMRSIAASVWPQYRGLSNALYSEARRMAERLPNTNEADISLEKIQAWLLIVQYELMRGDEHQAMVTAGIPFRLIQLSRIWAIDQGGENRGQLSRGFINDFSPVMNQPPSPVDRDAFTETEERRRTFWLAYLFDWSFHVRNKSLLTFHEDVIMVRLPAPEMNFQHGQPVQTDFLADALVSRTQHAEWSFAEAIIMSTLLGRCVALQRRVSVVSCLQTSTNNMRDFWTNHAHLTSEIDERRQNLIQSFPSNSVLVDPMLAFTHLLPHAAIICLGETLANIPPQTVPTEHQFTATMYRERAIMAAREITRQAQLIPRVAFCKAHPFLPHVLARAADHIATHSAKHGSTGLRGSGSGKEADLTTLLRVLKDIGEY
ncbi:hypothetical protein VP1G_01037 [Cytospora mali]|uniref:Xylanolytic transcriptional activator regulatory domain-containing protein n=1 Tax=Cytospora mali TaxID=578113 RepID=A0A194UP94_CYTMA|nr:hypothetical protein VP1G_01037 [Valsa mali var. pyri (nom. inval.)]